MIALPAVILLALLTGAPSRQTPAAGAPMPLQTTCPADDPGLREHVESFLANERIQMRVGLSSLASHALRALNDSTDAAVCQTLRTRTAGKPINLDTTLQYAFMEADGHYFVAVVPHYTDGRLSTRPGALYLFRPDFSLITVASL